MAKLFHMSIKSRYRLLLTSLALAILYLYLSTPEQPISTSASLERWTAIFDTLKTDVQSRAQTQASHFWSGNHQDNDPYSHKDSTTPNNGAKTQDKKAEEGAEHPEVPFSSLQASFFNWKGPDYLPGPKPPHKPPRKPGPPIPDPFPLLSHPLSPSSHSLFSSSSKTSLKKLQAEKLSTFIHPPNSKPMNGGNGVHYEEETPLFIGFTRNWPQLLQCVVSYIAAGWPPGDIYVVENTGVMNSNKDGKLSLQNPFYLNHTQLGMLGVNVIVVSFLLLHYPPTSWGFCLFQLLVGGLVLGVGFVCQKMLTRKGLANRC